MICTLQSARTSRTRGRSGLLLVLLLFVLLLLPGLVVLSLIIILLIILFLLLLVLLRRGGRIAWVGALRRRRLETGAGRRGSARARRWTRGRRCRLRRRRRCRTTRARWTAGTAARSGRVGATRGSGTGADGLQLGHQPPHREGQRNRQRLEPVLSQSVSPASSRKKQERDCLHDADRDVEESGNET